MSRPEHQYDPRFDAYYTDLHDALTALKERRRSEELKNKVHTALQLTPELEHLLNEPYFFIFRQVGTPILEVLHIFTLAKKNGFRPFILEYYDDTYVSAGNQFKRGLGRLPVYQFTSPSGRDVFEYRTVLDFNSAMGKPICDLKTIKNENLIEFHHFIFDEIMHMSHKGVCVDASSWFKKFNKKAEEYYVPLMELFIRDAILFEIFITCRDEERFSDEVAFPAFTQAENKYGLKPLIVRTVSKEDEQRMYWDCYPTEVDVLLKKKGYI